MSTGRCRRCSKPLRWAQHRGNGTNSPLDPQPSPDGNLLVAPNHESKMQYQVLTRDELQQARTQGVQLSISHFATCTERPANRREKGRTLPEELLARASTKQDAADLANEIASKFFRHTYVHCDAKQQYPYEVMTDEELTPGARLRIKEFIGEYVAARRQPQLI